MTLGGQSAGSTSTAANVISPGAAGLFQRALFQSGALLTVAPLSLAESRGTAFAEAAGCPGSDAAAAACLRALSAAQVMALQGTVSANGPYMNGLVVDGTVLPRPADEAWSTGQFNHMPIMNGTVQDEGNFGIGITEYFSGPPRVPMTAQDYVDAVLAEYPLSDYPTPQLAYDAVTTHPTACRARHLNQLVSQWVPVYAYEFNYQDAPYYFPDMPGFVPLAAHTIDIQFLLPLWHGGPLGIVHPLNRQEEHLSDKLVDAWTSFTAQRESQRGSRRPAWSRYDPAADNYLSENVPHFSTFTGPEFSDNHHCDFWDHVLIYLAGKTENHRGTEARRKPILWVFLRDSVPLWFAVAVVVSSP